jgi:hypothetical protein
LSRKVVNSRVHLELTEMLTFHLQFYPIAVRLPVHVIARRKEDMME